METNKEYKIALVLYTSGLDYDDRIRKEILTIQKCYPNIKFKIFAVDSNNREESGVTSYGVEYRIPYLKSRDKYKSGSSTYIKAWDFYKSIKRDLKQYDAVWCADVETFMFALLLKHKPILWDLHELPTIFMNSWWKKILFRFAERRVKVMLHANEPRLQYLKSLGLVRDMDKQFVIRNYPDFNEIDNDYDDTYNCFVQWLGNDRCVYLQSIVSPDRADEESIGAVLSVPNLKAVVVGKIGSGRMERFEQLFGKEELSDRVFFTGMQKQLKTPQYIRKCIMSLVFYKNTSMNNWYCEPNRLFQNINNGNPVIVGLNPPMKEIVDRYGVGVCADTDGSNQDKIVFAIKETLENIDDIKKNIELAQGQWMWGSQESVIKSIVEKFLV